MDHRERFLAVLCGEASDRIPVYPQLDFWYRARKARDDWPDGLAGRSQDDIQLALGMGLTKGAPVARPVYREPVSYRTWRDGLDEIEVWETPRGTLRRVRRHEATHDEIGMVPHLAEYPIKCLDDYAIYIEAMNHLEFVRDPGYLRFRRWRAIGAARFKWMWWASTGRNGPSCWGSANGAPDLWAGRLSASCWRPRPPKC